MTEPVGLHPAKVAEAVWVIGDRVTFAGPLPGTDFVLVDIEVPPGSGTPLHRHASPELFRVLSGELVFAAEAGWAAPLLAGPGDVVSVPPDAIHAYRNPGPAPARMLVVLDRAMETFFRDLGADAPIAGPPRPEDLARIGAACARHGVVLLEGPPPA
ncbi:cupin domain-containing protein [Falsiroseomonas oryziterrae]|uniref:cupin domain-containing protein n=1 Tax=Falsiroseomonas oryziterrae TaxID=2911368 RepID=UPI001F21965F|nr:cupin domain-containing protein [Roseomonas sp. NPKOSM-4]